MSRRKEYIMSLRREKAIRNLSIVSLVVAILSVSMAYAAISKNLQIIKLIENDNVYIDDSGENDASKNIDDSNKNSNSSSNNASNSSGGHQSAISAGIIVQNNFDVGFYNLSKLGASAGVVINNEPQIKNNDKKISGFDITFNKPGQYVAYTVDIKNKENIDGIIDSLNKYISACDTNDSTVDERIVCDGIKYEIYYTDTNVAIKKGDLLNVGESKNITIKISYDNNNMPSQTVDVTDLSYSIVYTAKE